MARNSWRLLAIISAAISVYVNFNLLLWQFLVGSVALALLLFVILNLVIARSERKQHVGRKIIAVASLSVILVLVYGSTLGKSFGGCQLVTPPHFRTNILTGACDFGGASSECPYADPWYFEQGCDISKEEKIELIKKSDRARGLMHLCSQACARSAADCDQPLPIGYPWPGGQNLVGESILCSDLISDLR